MDHLGRRCFRRLLRGVCLVVGVAVAAIVVPGGALAQQNSASDGADIQYVLTLVAKQQREIAELRQEVQELKRAVQEFRKAIAKPGLPAAAPNVRLWRTLRSGMSYDQVRTILGEPLRIEDGGSPMETWYYQEGNKDSAWVRFVWSAVSSRQEL